MILLYSKRGHRPSFFVLILIKPTYMEELYLGWTTRFML